MGSQILVLFSYENCPINNQQKIKKIRLSDILQKMRAICECDEKASLMC